MKKTVLVVLLFLIVFAICVIAICCCQKRTKKLPVSVLVAPHFEVGEMQGDDPGEAQMLFEEYFGNCEKYEVVGGVTLYYNPENRMAMYLTGCGKVNAATSTMAVLSDSRFDYSETRLLSVGCTGGAAGYSTLGDVVLETAVCDYDLGHTADVREMEGSDTEKLWFASSDYDEFGCRKLDPDMVARAFELTKDIRLETTDISRNMLARNFPGEAWAERDPAVVKGTSMTSDNYWKGKYNHEKAKQIAEYYQCTDPYASTEMEDMAVVFAAERFGLLNRTLVLRVSVNIDMFFDGATPESLWGENTEFIDAVSETNEETLDIFAPAMRNLFAVSKTIIDSMLNREF